MAFIVRLYGFTNPVADWHSWRQADTSAVSRNFVKTEFDILHPRFDDLSNVPSGIENLNGYRFVEFPLYNIAQAGLTLLFPFMSLEQWGRMVTILSSLGSLTFLYLLVKKYTDEITGLFVACVYAFLPFSVYYSRVILPDPSMVMASLGGIYFFLKYVEDSVRRDKKQWLYYGLSLLFTISAFLLKPYALIFTLPMVYIAWKEYRFAIIKRWELWLFAIIAVIPLGLWRVHMMQFPEGIPVNAWLFNGGNIRFKGAFFFWIFGDRIARLIMGYWGIFFLGLGILHNSSKQFGNMMKGNHRGFFFSFLLSSVLYITILARGNVQHDYYQILIMPTIAIFAGMGARFVFFPKNQPMNQVGGIILGIIVCFLTLILGWYFIRDYYHINNESIVIAGKAVDRLTPKDALVVAPLDGDTSFLYQTNRQGWASFSKGLAELKDSGADYLVLVNPQEKDLEIGKTYKIVEYRKEYLLFNLNQTP